MNPSYDSVQPKPPSTLISVEDFLRRFSEFHTEFVDTCNVFMGARPQPPQGPGEPTPIGGRLDEVNCRIRAAERQLTDMIDAFNLLRGRI